MFTIYLADIVMMCNALEESVEDREICCCCDLISGVFAGGEGLVLAKDETTSDSVWSLLKMRLPQAVSGPC